MARHEHSNEFGSSGTGEDGWFGAVGIRCLPGSETVADWIHWPDGRVKFYEGPRSGLYDLLLLSFDLGPHAEAALREGVRPEALLRRSSNVEETARLILDDRRARAAVKVARVRYRGDPCVYCGCFGASSIDHIDPRVSGGSHDLGNMAPACMRCNREKHAKPLLIFLAERTLA